MYLSYVFLIDFLCLRMRLEKALHILYFMSFSSLCQSYVFRMSFSFLSNVLGCNGKLLCQVQGPWGEPGHGQSWLLRGLWLQPPEPDHVENVLRAARQRQEQSHPRTWVQESDLKIFKKISLFSSFFPFIIKKVVLLQPPSPSGPTSKKPLIFCVSSLTQHSSFKRFHAKRIYFPFFVNDN